MSTADTPDWMCVFSEKCCGEKQVCKLARMIQIGKNWKIPSVLTGFEMSSCKLVCLNTWWPDIAVLGDCQPLRMWSPAGRLANKHGPSKVVFISGFNLALHPSVLCEQPYQSLLVLIELLQHHAFPAI